jgi:hypothetical protein
MPPRKHPWFRVYVELIWDRKIRRLSPEHRWLWIVCLACARSSPVSGFLLLSEGEPMIEDDFVDAASLKVPAVRSGLKALESLGLIEWDATLGAWQVTKWNERQFESDETSKRTAKHRSKERSNVSRTNVDVAPPETEAETETENRGSPLPPASGGSRANGTSKRQREARTKYQRTIEAMSECEECDPPGFKCLRHTRRLGEAESELRALSVPREVWEVGA